MKPELQSKFILLWKKYFGETELPITFYYTAGNGGAEKAEKPKGRSCLICELSKVRNGKSLWYNIDSLACGGARRYLGYTDKMRPGFEYFLSCGTIIHYPYLESLSDKPRAIIGMFDPSARPCVPENTLTFAVAMNRFEQMIGSMDESFLITETWTTVKTRLTRGY
jgi:hypothetical protein